MIGKDSHQLAYNKLKTQEIDKMIKKNHRKKNSINRKMKNGINNKTSQIKAII